MVQTLRRVTSEADHHKVLDIFYLVGFVVGAYNVAYVIQEFTKGVYSFNLVLALISFVMMTVCAALGYYYHFKWEGIYKEAAVIVPIIAGYITGCVGYTFKITGIIGDDSYAPSLTGMSVGIAVFVCIEGVMRILKLRNRLKQIRRSEVVRSKPITAPEQVINQKAAEIIRSIKTND